MAARKLRWGRTKIDTFPDGRACLVVQFLDAEGGMYEWVPAWAQVRALFERASNTEVVNKPKSTWIADFAKTAHAVFEKLGPLYEAYKIAGVLVRVRGGNLVLSDPLDSETEIPPAFQMTEGFFRDWLGTYVTALVINGYVIQLWRIVRYEYAEGDREEELEWPPTTEQWPVSEL